MNTQPIQKATLPAADVKNAKWPDNKEQVRFKAVVAFDGRDFARPVTARWWMGRSTRSSVVRCTIWASNSHHSFNGHGSAAGFGYHKPSAALQAAIDSARIKLEFPIDGRGDSAEDEALTAIARALGYDTTTVVEG